MTEIPAICQTHWRCISFFLLFIACIARSASRASWPCWSGVTLVYASLFACVAAANKTLADGRRLRCDMSVHEPTPDCKEWAMVMNFLFKCESTDATLTAEDAAPGGVFREVFLVDETTGALEKHYSQIQPYAVVDSSPGYEPYEHELAPAPAEPAPVSTIEPALAAATAAEAGLDTDTVSRRLSIEARLGLANGSFAFIYALVLGALGGLIAVARWVINTTVEHTQLAMILYLLAYIATARGRRVAGTAVRATSAEAYVSTGGALNQLVSGSARHDQLLIAGSGSFPVNLLTPAEAAQMHVELLAGNATPPGFPDAIAKCLVVVDTGCGRSMSNHPAQF